MQWWQIPARQEGPILIFEDAHHDIIVPLAGHKGAVSGNTFLHEAALSVAGDGTVVVLQDDQVHTMQAKAVKGMAKYEAGCLRPVPMAPGCRAEEADGIPCVPSMLVQDVEAGVPDAAAFRFDHPPERVRGVPFVPVLYFLDCHRLEASEVPTVHPDGFSAPRAQQPIGLVAVTWSPKNDMLAGDGRRRLQKHHPPCVR
jgi:hypothetical protein